MRENRFSENSCSGRKTNSPSLSLQFGWQADAGPAALGPGPQAVLAADGRSEELALLLLSFPAVTVGHGDTLLYELWMRLLVSQKIHSGLHATSLGKNQTTTLKAL